MKKKNLYNIFKNHTLEEYKSKYDISKAIVLTKDAVDNFNKKHKAKNRKSIFEGRNWWLIDDNYYEVGDYLSIKPKAHKSHGAGFKIAMASILGGIGIAGALGGGGYVIYKAVQGNTPTPGPEPGPEPEPEPTVKPIIIEGDGSIKAGDKAKLVGKYEIPEKIDGVTVKSVAPNGFNGCSQLTEVILPKTVESIGERAFNGCSSLTTVTLPSDSVLSKIDARAFANCQALTTINIPESVETIEASAFKSCTSLKNFTIATNSKLKTIGESAFEDCSTLDSFTFPDSLETIESYAFTKSNIESVKINSSSSLQKIGSSAFVGCSNLKEVTFENENVELGFKAFGQCESLIKCALPTQLTTLPSECFNGYYSLSSVSIPTSLTTINSYVFNDCYSLGNVTLPEGLKTIDTRAFGNCCSMTEIVIPSTVESFGIRCFEYCYSLRTVYVKSPNALVDLTSSSNNYDSKCLFQYANEVYIGANITSAKETFCNDLKNNYDISDSTEKEGYSRKAVAHSEMYFLAYDWGDPETSTMRYYRYSDETQTDVTITPDGNGGTVHALLGGAFYNNPSIKTVTVPACVESLGATSFYGCTSLDTITFLSESQLSYISENCFQNSGIKNITLPESVKYIYPSAFENCTSLTQINIPAAVEIDDSYFVDIFKGCTSLATITIDSAEASKLKTNNSCIFNAEKILLEASLKADLEEGDYLFDHYTISSEASAGYYVCIKKSE